ncbi:hypothetical protein [Bradyrhizobium sp. 199]|uniref:hypothetical protein n=1 Tax=Bradyrhizobium sp. 199 TaxID=2782664 RepID=UPI001FF92713|nr:hypothetical protein [Bradyrhizobium sp. 199]MCK1357689.1 hypothetical protein [Bradyrhizobium sp. 199]
MFLVDALLILAMLFFLFLPITDRRTVRMRLCMVCALLAVFSASVTRARVVPVLLAGLASSPEALRPPPMFTSDPASRHSPRSTWDVHLLHGQGKF